MHDITRGAMASIGVNVEINTTRALPSRFPHCYNLPSFTLKSQFTHTPPSLSIPGCHSCSCTSTGSVYSTYLVTSILENLFVSFRGLQESIFKPSEKTRITIVVLGHLDHGKSTTTGHMVYKCGASMLFLSSDLLCAGARPHDNHSPQEAAGLGKASFKYAWVLDKLRAERERGITIDISLCTFETPKYAVTVIDAPGHRDYIKNTITGASQADCALLVTSAATDEFEAGVDQGGQSRQHLVLAFTLGVRQLIVAVNKMDTIRWSQDRFNEVVKETAALGKKIGYNPKATAFVPISGFHGDNMLEYSWNMPWFMGWTKETKGGAVKGKTLLDAIDAVEPPSHCYATDKPLRLPIRDVQEVPGIGTVLVGRIETGTITPGMELTIAPTNITAEVLSINSKDEELLAGHAGDHVSVHITEVEEDIRPGYVAGDPNNDPPESVASFNAQVVILNHPGEISPGYIATVDCLTAHIPCRLSRILHKKDRRTGRPTEQSPDSIRAGDCAIVEMVPTKPMCVEPYSEKPCLGRFIIREESCTAPTTHIASIEKNKTKVDAMVSAHSDIMTSRCLPSWLIPLH
ncbi:P-loop containing nucleoside triphosphate hydrolase protein [Aspergillus sergii]|uniref:Elongation factor 1-alpha n=1 Tax=Aspergillus sergii TaxID=1034303 RepID=A0A5N6WRT3_9EURO|nr:P-loop containing nucleoside triphosphate hydrolase protein [Aspergillus sergii]